MYRVVYTVGTLCGETVYRVLYVLFCIQVNHNLFSVEGAGGDVKVYHCEQELLLGTSLAKGIVRPSSVVTPANRESSVVVPSTATASPGVCVCVSVVLC